MKKNKLPKADKIFSLEGCTSQLVDGETRCITLVGVVQVINENSYIYEPSYKLSVGLSVIAPMDIDDVEDGLSIVIGAGKALKPKTCLMTLESPNMVFNKYMVNAILKTKLDHIINNPNTYIKVSPKKSN